MLNNLRLNTRNLIKSSSSRILSTRIPTTLFYNLGVKKNYNQVKDLNQTMLTAEMEESQRKAKILEYTTKIYKPSKTITFDRNGEALLFSCDNIKHSQVYLKYPYCLIDSLIPLAVYIFFCDPFNLTWQMRHAIFHTAWIFGWMPHFLYIRSLNKKIHKIYLMRGGKYCRMELMDLQGVVSHSWITNRELHLLTQDHKSFAESEEIEFMNKEGQLKFELGVQLDHFQYHNYNHNNDVIFFMKEGTVHEPEIFEQVCRGYNIDTSDFQINTEDNLRLWEPHKNI